MSNLDGKQGRRSETPIQNHVQEGKPNGLGEAAAHDLQNYLTFIIGLTELLERNHAALTDEELHNYLRAIAHKGRAMSYFIEGLRRASNGC